MNKMNNKGFSLVELIVVIAIMAVLMGVLAPTLIGNIEKSRETKDLQALDAVYQAFTHAVSTEAGAKQAASNTITNEPISSFMGSAALSGNWKTIAEDVQEELGASAPTLSAGCNSDASDTFYITVNPTTKKVYVKISDAAANNPNEAERTKDDTGAKKKMEVGTASSGSTTATTTAGTP